MGKSSMVISSPHMEMLIKEDPPQSATDWFGKTFIDHGCSGKCPWHRNVSIAGFFTSTTSPDSVKNHGNSSFGEMGAKRLCLFRWFSYVKWPAALFLNKQSISSQCFTIMPLITNGFPNVHRDIPWCFFFTTTDPLMGWYHWQSSQAIDTTVGADTRRVPGKCWGKRWAAEIQGKHRLN